jgi:4-alpha-glucanotransferase
MRFPRSSGILLHPTSLPGPFGIGDLGPEACAFVDFLAAAGQTLWQVLPLGPTGYGNSPYQCFSAVAGNPLLISPELLARKGWLSGSALETVPAFLEDDVDFAHLIPRKTALLESAARRFLGTASDPDRPRFEEFCARQHAWLEDYALFMALKHHHQFLGWSRWELEIRFRAPGALAAWREKLAGPIAIQKFLQYVFFDQWKGLRDYCSAHRVRIMGDLPIYVAHDSADVWANPQFFRLDHDGEPAVVAGVPPDYFSATGQLWGNPIYRWDVLAADGYRWWLERFAAVLSQVDFVRLDHFRGFEAYWEVPASEKTAERGCWVKGPGAALFEAARTTLGDLPLVAENLGVITPEVEAIRRLFGFPGMSILQFAFGNDPQGPSFRPHNYPRELVAYTGTHDCDTTMGWWSSEGAGDSTRNIEDIRAEREFTQRYLHTDGREIHWVFIRELLASVADTVLIPLQDVLGLGSHARMNRPSTLGGNWRWRYRREMLAPELAARLWDLTGLYDRR